MRPGAERGSVVMTRPVGSQSLDSMRSGPWTRFWGTQGCRSRSEVRASRPWCPVRLVPEPPNTVSSDWYASNPALLRRNRPPCPGYCLWPSVDVASRHVPKAAAGSIRSLHSLWTRFWENPRPGARPDRQGGARSCQGGARTDVDTLCGVVGSAVRYRWLNAVAADEAFKSATCDRWPPNVCSVRA